MDAVIYDKFTERDVLIRSLTEAATFREHGRCLACNTMQDTLRTIHNIPMCYECATKTLIEVRADESIGRLSLSNVRQVISEYTVYFDMQKIQDEANKNFGGDIKALCKKYKVNAYKVMADKIDFQTSAITGKNSCLNQMIIDFGGEFVSDKAAQQVTPDPDGTLAPKKIRGKGIVPNTGSVPSAMKSAPVTPSPASPPTAKSAVSGAAATSNLQKYLSAKSGYWLAKGVPLDYTFESYDSAKNTHLVAFFVQGNCVHRADVGDNKINTDMDNEVISNIVGKLGFYKQTNVSYKNGISFTCDLTGMWNKDDDMEYTVKVRDNCPISDFTVNIPQSVARMCAKNPNAVSDHLKFGIDKAIESLIQTYSGSIDLFKDSIVETLEAMEKNGTFTMTLQHGNKKTRISGIDGKAFIKNYKSTLNAFMAKDKNAQAFLKDLAGFDARGAIDVVGKDRETYSWVYELDASSITFGNTRGGYLFYAYCDDLGIKKTAKVKIVTDTLLGMSDVVKNEMEKYTTAIIDNQIAARSHSGSGATVKQVNAKNRDIDPNSPRQVSDRKAIQLSKTGSSERVKLLNAIAQNVKAKYFQNVDVTIVSNVILDSDNNLESIVLVISDSSDDFDKEAIKTYLKGFSDMVTKTSGFRSAGLKMDKASISRDGDAFITAVMSDKKELEDIVKRVKLFESLGIKVSDNISD